MYGAWEDDVVLPVSSAAGRKGGKILFADGITAELPRSTRPVLTKAESQNLGDLLQAVMAQLRILNCMSNHNWSLLCHLYCAWSDQVCLINTYFFFLIQNCYNKIAI